MKQIHIDNIKCLDKAAEAFAEAIGDYKVIAFYGSMGAGKTTFITALCRYFGVNDDVCSPTFTIVNEYLADSVGRIYHFDFYRINGLREAVDIGFDEYLYAGNLCLIEWPEKVEELLPEDCLIVRIEPQSDDSRVLTIENI